MSGTSESVSIGLLIGSTRVKSNTSILSHYIATLIDSHHPNVTIELMDLIKSPGHPLPLVHDDVAPGAINPESQSNGYNQPAIRAWSAKVLQWDAIIVVTPEYNWNVPGVLKQAFDHLYYEWHNKPVTIITIGETGGEKAQVRLREMLEGALLMKVTKARTEIVVSRGQMSGNRRWAEDDVAFVSRADDLLASVDELLELVEESRKR